MVATNLNYSIILPNDRLQLIPIPALYALSRETIEDAKRRIMYIKRHKIQ
jgi:hypothetical protein